MFHTANYEGPGLYRDRPTAEGLLAQLDSLGVLNPDHAARVDTLRQRSEAVITARLQLPQLANEYTVTAANGITNGDINIIDGGARALVEHLTASHATAIDSAATALDHAERQLDAQIVAQAYSDVAATITAIDALVRKIGAEGRDLTPIIGQHFTAESAIAATAKVGTAYRRAVELSGLLNLAQQTADSIRLSTPGLVDRYSDPYDLHYEHPEAIAHHNGNTWVAGGSTDPNYVPSPVARFLNECRAYPVELVNTPARR